MNVYFSLGNKCNLNCIYCFNSSLNNLSPIEIDSIGYITMERIVRYLTSKQEKIIINFTGGEPVIYKDTIIQLLRNISDLEKQIENTVITTNGTLLNSRILEEFREVNNNIIFNISIDGSQDIHNLTRKSNNLKDTYKSANNGLNLLKQYGFKVYINSVITKLHINLGAAEYYKFMKSFNTPFQFGKGSFLNKEYEISESEFVNFILDLIELWENDSDINDNCVWLDGILSYILNSQNNTFDEHCGSNQMISFAGNNGLMWLCPRFIPYKEYCLGSFDEITFDEQMNSAIRTNFSNNFRSNTCTYELELYRNNVILDNITRERQRLFKTVKEKLDIK